MPPFDMMKQLEADVQFSNIPGYFPTPKPVVQQMIQKAHIAPGMKVLEPSAGKGNIVDAINNGRPSFTYEWLYQSNLSLALAGP